jgi:hypothetical protein
MTVRHTSNLYVAVQGSIDDIFVCMCHTCRDRRQLTRLSTGSRAGTGRAEIIFVVKDRTARIHRENTLRSHTYCRCQVPPFKVVVG